MSSTTLLDLPEDAIRMILSHLNTFDLVSTLARVSIGCQARLYNAVGGR